MKKFNLFLLVALIMSALVAAGCSSSVPGEGSGASSAGAKVQIFKSMSCGCCSVYTKYMGQRGFSVEVKDVADISLIKSEYNVPSAMQSCHTTIVGGYFVEGHIPSEAIDKLLSEKPAIKGIAMPGMPSGAPGMPGSKQGPFVIYAVHTDGSTSEFMRI